jgi:hypothetical protein
MSCVIDLIFLFAVLLRGASWTAENVLPWLVICSEWIVVLCLFILAPLCVFRRTRPWAGLGFFLASYLFGSALLAYGCAYDVYTWGYWSLLAGLLLFGLGVLPVAFVAALFHGEWFVVLDLAIGVLFTFGARGLGILLIQQAEGKRPSGAFAEAAQNVSD